MRGYGWEQTELGAWKEADGVLFDGVIFTVKKEEMRVRGLEGEAGVNQSPARKARGQTGLLSNVRPDRLVWSRRQEWPKVRK